MYFLILARFYSLMVSIEGCQQVSTEGRLIEDCLQVYTEGRLIIPVDIKDIWRRTLAVGWMLQDDMLHGQNSILTTKTNSRLQPYSNSPYCTTEHVTSLGAVVLPLAEAGTWREKQFADAFFSMVQLQHVHSCVLDSFLSPQHRGGEGAWFTLLREQMG